MTTNTSVGRGMGPPRFNTAWRAVRESSMDDEAISRATMVLPFIVTDMRAHWVKLRDMDMAPLYSWEAEMERAKGLAFHLIDRCPGTTTPTI